MGSGAALLGNEASSEERPRQRKLSMDNPYNNALDLSGGIEQGSILIKGTQA